MDLETSPSYQYLVRFHNNIDPENIDQLRFKQALSWVLQTVAEQAQTLLNIEEASQAYNSDIVFATKSRPKLRLIKND